MLHHVYGPQVRNRISHGEFEGSPARWIIKALLNATIQCNLIISESLSTLFEYNQCFFSNEHVSLVFLDNSRQACLEWYNKSQRVESYFLKHKDLLNTFIVRRYLPNPMTARIQTSDLLIECLCECNRFDKNDSKCDRRKKANILAYENVRSLLFKAFVHCALDDDDYVKRLCQIKRIYKYVRAHKWTDVYEKAIKPMKLI